MFWKLQTVKGCGTVAPEPIPGTLGARQEEILDVTPVDRRDPCKLAYWHVFDGGKKLQRLDETPSDFRRTCRTIWCCVSELIIAFLVLLLCFQICCVFFFPCIRVSGIYHHVFRFVVFFWLKNGPLYTLIWLYMLTALKTLYFILNWSIEVLSIVKVLKNCLVVSGALTSPSSSETALAVIISGVWVNVPAFSLLSCQHDWHAFCSWFIQKPWLITTSFLPSFTVPNAKTAMLLRFKRQTLANADISFCCTLLHFCLLLLSLPLPFFRSYNVGISDYRSFVGLFCVIRSLNWGPSTQ